ncbi:MAG: autotransporter domain-containing protein [Saprospiraceae bacterium]
MATCLVVFFSSVVTPSQAQIGVNLGYTGLTARKWENIMNLKNFEFDSPFGPGLHVGVDYAYKLKDIRIEVVPELNMQFYKETQEIPDEFVKLDLAMTYAGLDINGHFYLLDLYGECDCPTFSKKGPWLNKGLFIIATLGGGMYLKKATNTLTDVDGIDSTAHIDDNSFAMRIGLGLGMDIGVSKTFTVTPMIKFQFSPAVRWDGFADVGPVRQNLDLTDQEKSGILRFTAGVRFGFHPPKKY